MQKYIWEEKYSVGVKEIDNQHKHFLEIVHQIIDLTDQENILSDDISAKISDMNDYAIYHFTTEENFFKHFAYPETEEHIATHDAYKERIDKFIAETEKAEMDTKKTALEMAEFAGSWLTNHIMAMDQKYTDFMHKNGVK